MKKMTKEMILNKAKELNIKFIRLRFTDILGKNERGGVRIGFLNKVVGKHYLEGTQRGV